MDGGSFGVLAGAMRGVLVWKPEEWPVCRLDVIAAVRLGGQFAGLPAALNVGKTAVRSETPPVVGPVARPPA